MTQGAFLKLLDRWDQLDHEVDLEGICSEPPSTLSEPLPTIELAAKRVLAPGRAEADPFVQVAER